MHVSFVVIVSFQKCHPEICLAYAWPKQMKEKNINEGLLKMSLFDVDPKYHGLTNEMTFGQFDHLEIIWKSL